ncbi:hypothetical protein ZOSMA_110G00200 [Zostera marina]|uniref:Uncharacterized protein n=1 Tax=Zostera marina TaxID=29655 RepID=A0A0K9Q3H1_ZOSMR|nr:hypothetical protein ZOSMA_110G00200 [Zostera marina]
MLEQDKTNIEEAMETIQKEFDFSGTNQAYRHINKRLNKLWRTAHNSLVAKYDNKNLSIEEVMKILPDYIIKD